MFRRSRRPIDWGKRAQMAQFYGLIAIPVTVLGLIGSLYVFKAQQASNAQQALDQERQTTLDNYLSEISNLALNYKLTSSTEGMPVNALAVAQTDTSVRYLDGNRKGILIRYLWESGLISGPTPVISLYEINLNGTVFTGANLGRVDLSTDSLTGADFSDAKPYGAYLSGAYLRGADLSGADLSCFKSGQPGISAGILGILRPENVTCTGTPGTATPGGANLVGANLSGANLSGTNLVGANLSDADLVGANLEGATYNSKPMPPTKNEQGKTLIVEPTQWPTGFNPAAAGAICVAYC